MGRLIRLPPKKRMFQSEKSRLSAFAEVLSLNILSLIEDKNNGLQNKEEIVNKINAEIEILLENY